MSEEMAVYNASTVAPANNVKLATDVAGLCKEIVTATAQNIQGRKYVRVEGWQAIATAHGCVASARDVEAVEGGIRCIGEVRRMDTGAVICTAEGFVGDDEPTWSKRPLYARRAMCQTRAISRACRSAFAHVVVMMNAGLETTPAEEVPHDGFEPPKPVAPVPSALPPPPELPDALAKLEDGQTVKMEVRFDEIKPPPAGKKAHRVTLNGRDYPTMHNYDDCRPGDKLLVTFRASLFNGKIHVWADEHQNLQAEELPMDAAPAKLTVPAGVKEIWPDTEWGENVEIHKGEIGAVERPKVGKSGNPGPYKIDVQIGDQLIVVDTFNATLAALAKERSAVGGQHELAIKNVQRGAYLNRELVGLR